MRNRSRVRVVVFYADAHECDLANLVSARLTGSQDARRVASGASASPAFRSRIRPLARVVRRAWAFLRNTPPLSYVIALLLCGYRRARARWLVKALRPDVIVLFEDNIGNFTRYIGAAAALRNIPYVVVPITIPNPREAAGFFRQSKAHSAAGAIGRRIAHRWPQWFYDFDRYRMLRLPPPDILAMRALGVDNAKPWILNSGQASALCVESTANQAIYERLGLDPRQLAQIGNLADDTLFEVSEHRQERQRDRDSFAHNPSTDLYSSPLSG